MTSLISHLKSGNENFIQERELYSGTTALGTMIQLSVMIQSKAAKSLNRVSAVGTSKSLEMFLS